MNLSYRYCGNTHINGASYCVMSVGLYIGPYKEYGCSKALSNIF
jgi:hypothetical protein